MGVAPRKDENRFLDRAIHDLRAQVRQVRTSAELLGETLHFSSGSSSEEMLQHVLEGAAAIDRILVALGRYAVAREMSNYQFAQVDTEIALRTAVVSLQQQLSDSGAVVTHGPMPRADTDLDRLTEVFQILISNAVTYRGKEIPRIDIQAELKGDAWVVSVEDNGIGIEPHYWHKVFAPFFRLHGPEIPGVGLGLAIGKEIVEAHGGRIWIEPGTGAGVKFAFTLRTENVEKTGVAGDTNPRAKRGLP